MLQYRVVKKSDINQIIELFEGVFGGHLLREYYVWKYTYNNAFSSYCVFDKDILVAHVGYKINILLSDSKKYLFASRHTSMVKKEYRSDGLYLKLIKFSILKLQEKNISFVMAWPNINNMKATLVHDDFFPIFQTSTLTLKLRTKAEKLIKDELIFTLLSTDIIKAIRQKHSNDTFSINKSFSYLQDRYIDHPVNNYYVHCYQDKSSFIIFRIHSGYVNIVEFFSRSDLFSPHLEDFIESLGEYSCVIQSWCSIFEKNKYSSFLRSGFLPNEPIFQCGAYVLDERASDIISSPNKFVFSMGDSDVF
jgi:hypothetical protein